MALVSPGVEVTIIDESQYLPAAPASVPLILLATAQNKANAAGTGIAVATTAANANKLYRVTSQRDLVTLYGNPFFYKTTNGTPLQGYELNEYGLLAAYSVLGTSNLCYVLRADIDLASLVGRTGRPSGAPADGTYWLNTATSSFGLFAFNASTGKFTSVTPIIINDAADFEPSPTVGGQPLASIGNIGDYAVTFVTDTDNFTEAAKPSSYATYWFKDATNTWVPVGGEDWRMNWPTVQGTEVSPTLTAGDKFVITYNGIDTVIVLPASPDVTDVANEINAANLPFMSAANVDNKLEIYMGIQDSFELSNYTRLISTIARAAGTVTVTTSTNHGLTNGDNVDITGVTGAATSFNGSFTITVTGLTTFTYAQAGGNESGVTSASSLVVSGTPLTDMGITPGEYWAPALAYGTNAQQPLWRSTDSEPHPTGSVWIKTNNANLGTSIAISQYSSSTQVFTSRACTLSTSDWAITNSLDSAGGKNIPAGTLYAQYGFDGEELSAPLQIYRRVAEGAASFIGANSSPVFAPNATFDVYVSTPGLATLDGPYVVTMPASGSGTAPEYTPGAVINVDFVTAWSAAAIPNTTAQIAVTGAIVLTHTEGGVIIMDDSGVTSPASAVSDAGFEIGTTVDDNTLGAKWGPYKTVTATGVTSTGGSGTGAIFTVTSTGYVPTFDVTNGGGTYAVGDVLTVGGLYQVRVVSETGGVIDLGTSSVEWIGGFSVPQYSVLLSNWYPVSYVPNSISPTLYPVNGTNWYYSVVNQVDIMTNVGGVWKGYRNVAFASNGLPQVFGTPSTDPNGPIIAAVAPTTQADGVTALAYGDLWIDSNDLENYPVIYRWQDVDGLDQWVLIDNTDQLTENGIVFADARWGSSGTIDPIYDAIPSIITLLESDYLDLDAPSAQNYPQGTLLFNTRRSGYNVKQFVVNYFNSGDFPDSVLPQEKSAWVTASGNMSNGAPYMGRKAQRNMVVQALRSSINTNVQIREEDTFFNLMATPNYPELQPDMVVLNNDRNQTAYIVGDTPLRLPDDANAIVDWATNANSANSTGETGLVTRNTYMGIYYPSGITTDLTGSEVVIPSSHMILRTMIYNDTVAYPWFAPAGQRRGIVDNATNIGYIDGESGEFVVTKNRVQLRDIEYTNFINPIAFFTNIGILNYGNKNSFDSQSALDRTNVARLICYLRWNLQTALRPFIFEPNDSITRAQARGVVQTLLADIQSKRGLYDYLVVCDESNNTPARIDRNELWVDVAIEPVKAAEFIYVPVRILNTGEIAGLGQNG